MHNHYPLADTQKLLRTYACQFVGRSRAYRHVPVDVDDLVQEASVWLLRYSPDLLLVPGHPLRIIAMRCFAQTVRRQYAGTAMAARHLSSRTTWPFAVQIGDGPLRGLILRMRAREGLAFAPSKCASELLSLLVDAGPYWDWARKVYGGPKWPTFTVLRSYTGASRKVLVDSVAWLRDWFCGKEVGADVG